MVGFNPELELATVCEYFIYTARLSVTVTHRALQHISATPANTGNLHLLLTPDLHLERVLFLQNDLYTAAGSNGGSNNDDDAFVLENSIHPNIPMHLTDLFLYRNHFHYHIDNY